MFWKKTVLFLTILTMLSFNHPGFLQTQNQEEDFVSYIVDPKQKDVRLFWKDDAGNLLRNFSNLQKLVSAKNKKLVFAMNAGMYQENNTPLGLYVDNQKQVTPLNKKTGLGNFYLKPNGVFYIDTSNRAFIKSTDQIKISPSIKYATQSGPMLVADGVINPIFSKGSQNLNIRNGVGILPDGRILFAMSKGQINFYDFASYFKNAGCLMHFTWMDLYPEHTCHQKNGCNWMETLE